MTGYVLPVLIMIGTAWVILIALIGLCLIAALLQGAFERLTGRRRQRWDEFMDTVPGLIDALEAEADQMRISDAAYVAIRDRITCEQLYAMPVQRPARKRRWHKKEWTA